MGFPLGAECITPNLTASIPALNTLEQTRSEVMLLSIPTLAVASGGGFNPLALEGGGNLLWTLVIFAIALPLMWKLVMGPVTSALEERDAHASRAIERAETASRDAERARADIEVKLGEAQAGAAQLMSDARERAEVREQKIVEAAKHEASSMIEQARGAIQAEQDKAISTIRNEVVELSMNAASKVLERNVGGEDDRRMVSELVARSSKG
ncbi:MAG: F-type H+-transporting ATPase subunit b [Planctomycetota bacterium]|jgi:F-type H+-transporting ATPase subunit b